MVILHLPPDERESPGASVLRKAPTLSWGPGGCWGPSVGTQGPQVGMQLLREQNVCAGGMCAYLGMLSSTVAHPYRKTMMPTTDAGMSIWVYTPSQAKYRPIFSPKYFLHHRPKPKRDKLMLTAHQCGKHSTPLPSKEQLQQGPGCFRAGLRGSGWGLRALPAGAGCPVLGALGKVGHPVCDMQAGGVEGSVPNPTQRRSGKELWPGGAMRTSPPHITCLWCPQELNNFHGLDSGLQVPTGHTSTPLPAPGERTAFLSSPIGHPEPFLQQIYG